MTYLYPRNVYKVKPYLCSQIMSSAEELSDALILELLFNKQGRLFKDLTDIKYLRFVKKVINPTLRAQLKIRRLNCAS